MVHSAYDSLELFKDCPTKIDAVESYGSSLLVACADGSLRIYGPESSTSSAVRSPPSDRHSQTLELKRAPYVLERTVNGFSRKPMLAMEVLGSRELLLSLSDSISFHKLPNLETLAVITKAKGANAYSWDDRRGFLCFARQKRVCIFRHEGGRGFVEVKEFGVPDTVKSMSWCGENICLGIRRDYTILNATNGALSEVFPSGRIAPPLVVSLPSGELLLGKDNIGVLVDQNGKLLQEGRICWSEAPTIVVIQKPYATALLPRHIEIRSLRVPYPLIQTVVLRDVRHIHQGNNAVIVALSNSVYGLFPVPLGAQIVQLTASGNFEEALALCKLLPPEDSSLRTSKEQSIHIRYAHYLFENGSYEEAMDHFVASQVEITYVLSLYPSIVIPKSSVAAEPDKFLDVTGDAYLSRASSGMSDDMDSSSPSHLLEYDESSALESKKMSHNTLMALVKFLQKKRNNIIGKAAAEGTEEVVSDAVGHTFVSHESSRSKRSSKGRVNIPLDSGAREMAAVLDTALLQALLLTGQAAAALDLLKGLNYCDVKICEEILRNGNHYVCLLELYKCNSLHRDALKLLHQLVEESKSDDPKVELTQKFKPEMIIEYLKPLCGIDPMLVLEFSMLVLESCPTQTIDLFLSGNISADLVNSYLKQHAPSMQGTYLELMLSMNENGISGNLQNEMATNHQPSDLLVIIFSIVRNTFLDYSIYRFNLSEGWIPDLRWIRVQCKLHFSKTSAYYRGAMGFLLDMSMVTNTSDFCRGWFSYVLALLFAFLALFIVVTRYCIRGGPADEFKVIAPPPMNTMEQLLAVQNAISQAEELIQDGNVVLLKLCGLLLSIFPQASDHFAVALLITAVFVAFVPRRYVVLFVFLEEFTKYSPMRRSSTERWSRRLRQWWFSIPAAPVVLEKIKEDKKKK